MLNLDRDAAREQIILYNRYATGQQGPQTFIAVWDRRGRSWHRTQLIRAFGPGPGAPDSRLDGAWFGDLNRDGRQEVITRNVVSASAGKVLTIHRQGGRHSRVLKQV